MVGAQLVANIGALLCFAGQSSLDTTEAATDGRLGLDFREKLNRSGKAWIRGGRLGALCPACSLSPTG